MGQKILLQNMDLPENVPMQEIKVNRSENIPFTSVKDLFEERVFEERLLIPRRTNVDYGTRFQVLLPP